MSTFYGYSHYYRARYEAQKHAREQAQRALDRGHETTHPPIGKPREDDTRKGLFLMVVAMALPIMATIAVLLVAGS